MRYIRWDDLRNVDVLLGKTLVNIEKVEDGDDALIFTTVDGEKFMMYHEQDCCESVDIESIVGDLEDLIGEPILLAEEVEGETSTEEEAMDYDSYTWTFYKFATIKGYVDIRWYGSSNGYYSESVSFGIIRD